MSRHLQLVTDDMLTTDPTDLGLSPETTAARAPEPRRRVLSPDEQRARSADLAALMGWTPLAVRYGEQLHSPCGCGAVAGAPCQERRVGRRPAALALPHADRGRSDPSGDSTDA